MGERYDQAKRIFLAACGMERGERTRFVSTQCGQDADLHDQVRRLLRVDEEDEDFLQSPPPGVEAPALAAGAAVGQFRVVRPLGEGGMGVVYEAEQDEPRRRVALKVIRGGVLSASLRARFRHEVRILGRLRHPGIAQIYEAGTVNIGADPLPFFAMELVEGRPLAECCREQGLAARERLELVAQVCDAVHHAHVKGVVHRDLKPGNILVESAPSTTDTTPARPALQVKILDFGVARAAAADDPPLTIQTSAGQLIGTLPYMSPEQAAGDPGGVDARSDVYSIGVIAYELLCGRLPCPVHTRPLAEAARMIREMEPTRLGSIDRALRGDVETIVGKALEKDPARRYQSAAELAADIRRSLRDEPVLARPPSAMHQFRRFARRNRALVTAAALVFVAMAAATAVSTWQAREARRARASAEGEQRRADAAADAARREATRATLAGAAAAFAGGDPITAARLLDAADERSRSWAWRYWKARLDDCVALVPAGKRPAAVWMSPDAGRIAYVTAEGAVYRGSPWTGGFVETARLAETPVSLAVFIEGSGRVLTSGADRRALTLFDAADGRILHRHDPLQAPLGLMEASADGTIAVIGPRRPGRSPADILLLLRPRGPGPGWTAREGTIRSGTACAAVTPDGRWVALARGNDVLMVWDSAEDEPREFASLARASRVVALAEDGSVLASGGIDKMVRLWDRATGEPRRAMAGHSGTVTALRFDPSGRTVASAGADLTIRLWGVENGEPLATLAGHAAPVQDLLFSADGGTLLSNSDDGTIRLWRRDPLDGACVLRGHSSFVYGVAFSPDGTRLYSGAWDRSLRVWNAADGRPLGEGPSGDGYITAVAAGPRGRLATGHKTDKTQDATIRLWDGAALRPAGAAIQGHGEVSDLVFSAEGDRLYASWDEQGLVEYDLATEPPAARRIVAGPGVRSFALSPDGSRFAVGHADGSVSVVPAAPGGVARVLEGHADWVRGVAFHPTRPLLASASDDGTARLWNLATGAAAAELRGHADKVYAVAFSPDGRTLVTGSEDTTIGVWAVDEGAGTAEELTRLRGHDAYIYAVSFSPDGAFLVSASGDHTVRIWDTRPVRHRWQSRSGR